jgi:misacylated tRNA(Ala) deacylase
MEINGERYPVVFVGQFGGRISHEVSKAGIKEGNKIRGVINWDRRYMLMRHHTAAHLLSAVVHSKTGAMITGNQLNVDKSRIDFSLEEFDKEQSMAFVEDANKLVERDLAVEVSWISREEAEKGELCRLAKGMPPEIKQIRVVKIGDVDRQADGGTHVSSTREIGKILFLKADNKGKGRRRIYFRIT